MIFLHSLTSPATDNMLFFLLQIPAMIRISVFFAHTATQDFPPTSNQLQMLIIYWIDYRYYSGQSKSEFERNVLKKKLYHDVQELLQRNETVESCHRIFTTLDGELFNRGDGEGGTTATDDEVVSNHPQKLNHYQFRRKIFLTDSLA